MSCALRLLSVIKEVPTLRQFLTNEQEDPNQQSAEDEGWNEEWDWQPDEVKDSAGRDEQLQQASVSDWLLECEIAISPLGDLVILAKSDRIAVLQVSYEGVDNYSFTTLWKGVISEFPNEEITCLYCLPLISHKQSAQGAPEWSCVMVGFTSGHVRMYTETGTRVLDQMIHNESVMSIKCKTYSPSRYPGSSDLTEELTILYETVLVTLDGFGLFQTLRACKNQAAMAAASGSRSLELPPLGYKKWGLKGQGESNDHCSGGTYTPNPFDQMQSASLVGFNEKISPVPPTAHIYASCGDNPFISLYFMKEGQRSHLLYDVTGVATKLLSVGASTLMSWGSSLLGKKPADPPQEKPHHKIEAPTYVTPRFRLVDKRRLGQTVTMSPFGRTAAVTDTLGRVLLVDIYKGVINRVWKGYRNAQVAWMTVKEPHTASGRHVGHRHALFLLIYAPKRGLLEVWLADNGPRVGAFNVGKGCRLVYPGSTLLGLNSSTYKYVKGKIFQCFLMKPNGELMDVSIPFLLSLCDSNSKRAHDYQLSKVVKSILQEQTADVDSLSEELWVTISKLKLTSSHHTVLDKVLKTPYITSKTALSLIERVIGHIKKMAASQRKTTAEEEPDGSQLDVESRLLLEFCESTRTLISIHSNLIMLADGKGPDTKPNASPDCVVPVDDVRQSLNIKMPELAAKKVGFIDSVNGLNMADFLSAVEMHHGSKSSLRLKQLTSELLVKFGELLFKPSLISNTEISQVLELVDVLKIPPRTFVDMLLTYYLSLSSPPDAYLPALQQIIIHLYNFDKDNSDILEVKTPLTPQSPDYDSSPPPFYEQSNAPLPEVVSFWQYVREKCEESVNIKSYLHIALVCRSICITLSDDKLSMMEKEEPMETEQSPAADNKSKPKIKISDDKDTWEHLSTDVTLWNLTVKHIEDMALLNRFLQWSPRSQTDKKTNRSSLPDFITIKDMKHSNRGFIGEQVGKWCAINGISTSDIDDFDKRTATLHSKEEDSSDENLFMQLKRAFPLSLRDDVIYANGCWEYASTWNKDVECTSYFNLSLEYLKKISNGCLRHGICSMLWQVYIVKKLSSLVALISKVGKAPKDRLCKKEVDMDAATSADFLNHVRLYMDLFLEANCDFGEAELYQCEQSWEDTLSGHGLIDMASQQRETNYRLINHHASLVTITTAVLVFSMKSVKIMTLFDHNGVGAFFKDLCSHPYLGKEGKNDIVVSNRKHFMCQVIKYSVQSLPEWTTLTNEEAVRNMDKNQNAIVWPEIVMELGRKFELDLDYFKRYQVKELVSHGYDLLAIQILPSMTESTDACNDLLELCARRVVYLLFIAEQEKTTDITSKAQPSLLEWLQEKDYTELIVKDVPVQDTNRLLLHVCKGLKNSPSLYRYADDLYELTANV